MSKEYDIPQEVADIMVTSEAYSALMDVYAKLPFGYKKALKSSIKCEHEKRMFWKKINDLYPKLKNKHLTYNASYKTVCEKTKGNE